MHTEKIRFTVDDAQRAGDMWRFNCGPGALCAVLNKTPDEIRPMLGDFEKKGYTNPKLMYDILKSAGVKHRTTYRNDVPYGMPIVGFGLIRIQWGGPWTKEGVPMMARYRHTHWVAARNNSAEIFDINATCVGGWVKESEWSLQLVPWLCKQVVPKWDGTFWPTHAIEIG